MIWWTNNKFCQNPPNAPFFVFPLAQGSMRIITFASTICRTQHTISFDTRVFDTITLSERSRRLFERMMRYRIHTMLRAHYPWNACIGESSCPEMCSRRAITESGCIFFCQLLPGMRKKLLLQVDRRKRSSQSDLFLYSPLFLPLPAKLGVNEEGPCRAIDPFDGKSPGGRI